MQALQPDVSPARQLMGAELRQGPAAVPDTQQEGHSPAAGSGSSLASTEAETDGQTLPSGGRQPQLKRAAVAIGADEPAVLLRSAQAAWQRAREQAATAATRAERGVRLLLSLKSWHCTHAALHIMQHAEEDAWLQPARSISRFTFC